MFCRNCDNESYETERSNRNKKIFFLVGAFLLISILVFGGYVLAKGLFDSPKGKVLKAVLGIKDEFKNTLNDFAPEIEVADLFDTFYEKGTLDLSVNVKNTTDGFFAGVKLDPKNEKSEFVAKARSEEIRMTSIGNKLYAGFGNVLDYSILLDFDKTEEYKKKADQYAPFIGVGEENYPEILKKKNNEFKVYGKYRTLEDIHKGYLNYVKDDLKKFYSELKLEKKKPETRLKDMIKKNTGVDVSGTQYNTSVSAKTLENFAKKYVEFFYEEVLKDVVPYTYRRAYYEDISFDELGGKIDFNIIVKKGKLVALNMQDSQKSGAVFVFDGKENITDRFFIRQHSNLVVGEYDYRGDFSLENKGKETSRILYSTAYSVMKAENLKSKGEIHFFKNDHKVDYYLKNFKKEKSFVFVYEGLKTLHEDMVIEASVSVEKPEITEPANGKDLLDINLEEAASKLYGSYIPWFEFLGFFF